MPIPPRDHIVQVIGHTFVVHLHTISIDLRGTVVIRIVSIEIRLYVEQLQLTIRTCRDGKRNLHLLRVSRSRTCISRHHLVVDINLAFDVPIVCRRLHIAVVIDTIVGVAVVNDTFRLVDEVARGLVIEQFCGTISKDFLRQSSITILHIIRRQQCVDMRDLTAPTMFITGIDITTTLYILLHINQIKFNDTCDITINLIGRCTLL